MPSPMDFFEIGSEVGRRKRSTFGRAAENVLDQFKTRQQEEREFQRELGLVVAKEQIKNQLSTQDPLTNFLLDEPRGEQAGVSGVSKPTGATIGRGGPSTFESRIQQIQSKLPANVSLSRGGLTIKGGVPEGLRKDLAEAEAQVQQVGRLKALSENVGDVGVPVQAGGRSFISKRITGGRGSAQDEALILYESNVPAISAGLYRFLSGDKRLSNRDAAERAKPLVWQPGESENIKQIKNAIMEEAVQERAQAIRNGQFSTVLDNQGNELKLTPQVLASAENKLLQVRQQVDEPEDEKSQIMSSIRRRFSGRRN